MANSSTVADRRFQKYYKGLESRVLRLEHDRESPDPEPTPPAGEARFPLIFPLTGPLIISDSLLFKAPADLTVVRFEATLLIPTTTGAASFELVVDGLPEFPLSVPQGAGDVTFNVGVNVSLPEGSISFVRCISPGVGGADAQVTAWATAAG